MYLLGYFKGQNPQPVPPDAGDANGDGFLTGLDVVYLVAYFKGIGPPPPPVAPPGGGSAGNRPASELRKYR